MQIERERKSFTLIELLCVIGIIAVLITIMMPALQRVKIVTRLATCKSNIQGLYSGITMYTGVYNDDLPGTFRSSSPVLGTATNQLVVPDGSINGFGQLVKGGFVGNINQLYCPGVEIAGSNALKRSNCITSLLAAAAPNLVYPLACDYVLGWCSTFDTSLTAPQSDPNNICSPYSPFSPKKRLYDQVRLIWTGDCFGDPTTLYYSSSSFHGKNEYQNVGRIDGSAFTIHNFQTICANRTPKVDSNNAFPTSTWWTAFASSNLK